MPHLGGGSERTVKNAGVSLGLMVSRAFDFLLSDEGNSAKILVKLTKRLLGQKL